MNTLLYSVSTSPLTITAVLIILGSAVLCSVLISLTYMFFHRKRGFRPSVVSTFILLAPVSAVLMIVIGNSVARALSVGGGIALIRYRGNFEDPRDLAYVFMSMALGIACGNGLVGFAFAADAFLCLITILLGFLMPALKRSPAMRLKITVPEELNYYGVFDDILNKNCKGWELESVRTQDFGTLFELRYTLTLKDSSAQKEFIDELRTRNANLNIQLTGKNFEA